MIITGRRIRNLERYFGAVHRGTDIVIGLSDINKFSNVLKTVGLSSQRKVGESILPPSSLGPISEYNAEGKYEIHRDQPKETAYRTIEWHWIEWHGRYDRVEQSKFVDVPYQRYPRTFIPPPSIEFSTAKTTKGKTIIKTATTKYIKKNEGLILHTVNLFLEIFGECSIFTKDLNEIIEAPIRKLNWHVLPPGRMPWSKLSKEINPIIEEAPQGNRPLIRHRLKTVNAYKPEFLAVGRAGFRGYIILAFPKKNIYVLESIHYGNATYIFEEDWESLSQMTKAEILSHNLQKARIIHLANWEQNLRVQMQNA